MPFGRTRTSHASMSTLWRTRALSVRRSARHDDGGVAGSIDGVIAGEGLAVAVVLMPESDLQCQRLSQMRCEVAFVALVGMVEVLGVR